MENNNNNNNNNNDNGDQNRLDKGRHSLFATNKLLQSKEYLNSLAPDHVYSPEDNRLRSIYLQLIPPGYRFDPTDDELIVEYLIPKIAGRKLHLNLIHEINIYKHNPEDLAKHFIAQGSKEGLKRWYYFTPRDKKYPNGERPNRAAGNGYWKATGADKPVHRNSIEVGKKKALVFYKGRPPKGNKTYWIMHEYQVSKGNKNRKDDDTSMRLDDHVLCRIYEKVPQKILNQRKGIDEGVQDSVEDEPSSSLDDKFSPPIPNATKVHHNTNTDGQSYLNYHGQNQVNYFQAGQNQVNYFDGGWNNVSMNNYGNIGYPNQVNNGYMYNISNYGGSHNNNHWYNNNTMTHPMNIGTSNPESFPDDPSDESYLEYLNLENCNTDDQFLSDLENPTMPDAANASKDDKQF